jgi:hypothetical protein
MLPRSSRPNPTQFKAELTSCGYRGERQPCSLTGIDVISGFIFLSPGLLLVSFVLDEAALPFVRRKLRVFGKTGLHFRTASPEKLCTLLPIRKTFAHDSRSNCLC